MTEECAAILDDRPLRQGDVFQWVADAQKRPWALYGVVVTADCDLAKNKTRGLLSYVPVLVDEDYFWTVWRPDRFQSVLEKYARETAARLTKQLQKRNPDQRVMSPSSLLDWLQRRGPDGVVSDLGMTDNGQVKSFTERLRSLQQLADLMESSEPDYVRLRELLPLKDSRANPEKFDALHNEFQNVVTSLPGDTFFFSHIPDQPFSGYFAMLRYISQCALTDVAVSQEQLRTSDARAKRIGRMGSPFIYAMTQGLARVFADIGLPTSYEDNRKTSPSRLFASLEPKA